MISKDCHNLSHKELAKVIPGAHHNCIIILDDNREVWHKYLNNLIQVKPYYHFNSEKENDYLILGVPDHYLHYLAAFLLRAGSIAKDLKSMNQKVEIHKIVRKIHDQIFSERIITFTSVFPVGINRLAQPETRRIL
mgnify:CR=1 FL=1